MLFPDESYRLMGACFEVHNRLGCGFLEAVYQECLAREFAFQNIPFQPQPQLRIRYRDEYIDQTYQPDFICFEKILVELKTVNQLIDKHEAQVLNYLYASELELGLLINFGSHPKLEYKRLALSRSTNPN